MCDSICYKLYYVLSYWLLFDFSMMIEARDDDHDYHADYDDHYYSDHYDDEEKFHLLWDLNFNLPWHLFSSFIRFIMVMMMTMMMMMMMSMMIIGR